MSDQPISLMVACGHEVPAQELRLLSAYVKLCVRGHEYVRGVRNNPYDRAILVPARGRRSFVIDPFNPVREYMVPLPMLQLARSLDLDDREVELQELLGAYAHAFMGADLRSPANYLMTWHRPCDATQDQVLAMLLALAGMFGTQVVNVYDLATRRRMEDVLRRNQEPIPSSVVGGTTKVYLGKKTPLSDLSGRTTRA